MDPDPGGDFFVRSFILYQLNNLFPHPVKPQSFL